MRILLPPSETKRAGGAGKPLDLAGFREPFLNPYRDVVLSALQRLAEHPDESARVLKLSKRQLSSIDDNAALKSAPTMPAIERYTGVLYDALDLATLHPEERSWVDQHVFIQSAAFGRVAATDAIPTYRLSASTPLPGLAIEGQPSSLKAFWVFAHGAQTPVQGFTLDMRSKDYVALAPLSNDSNSAWVHVVQRDERGVVRALNHFNKTAKGQLVRLLANTRPVIGSREEFLQWASHHGVLCSDEPNGPITVFADSIRLRAR